jgi:hypothetical protein
VNATIGPRLEQFVLISKTAKKQRMKSKELTNLMKQRLFTPAYEATKVAHIVEHLSTTYWTISDQHLMPMVSSFGEMIAMSNKQEIEAAQRKIEWDAKKAGDEIESFIKKGHEEFVATVKERQAQLDSTFKKFAPELPEEEKKRIQDFAKKAVQVLLI